MHITSRKGAEMRKYGVGDGHVTEVEPDPQASLSREAAVSQPWDEQDERDLQEETDA
jgi:hypothetical protein